MTDTVSPPAYHLRLGITGHLELADGERVARGLGRLLATLAPGFAAPPALFTLVSPLALGADRLAARAVLGLPGARLEVVLPLPEDEYRRDFPLAVDQAEFDALLARAVRVERPPSRGGTREQAYLRAGQLVVDSCEILVAVWDGREAAGAAGTAEVVRYALAQERLVLWLDANNADAPAVVLRSVSFDAASRDGRLALRTAPLPATAAGLSPGYRQHAAFWRDGAVDAATVEAVRGGEARRFRAAAAAAALPPEALAPLLGQGLTHFARADCLALHYQRRHAAALKGVLYLGATAVTLAIAQAVFLPSRLWPTALEVVAMLGLLGLWLWARHRGWHLKWLNDRCLAERLRAALFTGLAGAADQPAAGRAGLPFYRGPSQWIADAAATQAGAVAAGTEARATVPAVRRFLLLAWLDHQRQFNLATATRKSARARSRHRLELGLIAGSFLMAVLHLAGVGHGAPEAPALLRVDAWITFLALVLLPWAGAVHAVTAQLELGRMAERARRMALGLERLALRMATAETAAEVAAVAGEAADLMGNETHEWWVLLSFQEARLHA